METLIGEAFVWMVGNRDALVLLVSFAFAVGIIYTLLAAWKFYEGRGENERL